MKSQYVVYIMMISGALFLYYGYLAERISPLWYIYVGLGWALFLISFVQLK